MSTNSNIIVQRADGKWAKIYTHWDGYLENNGTLLQKHYTTQELADALVALGDLSSLGETIGEKHDFDFKPKSLDGNDPEYQRLKKMCNAYGRDRGEDNVDAEVGDTFQSVARNIHRYTYVWSRDHGNPRGEWYIVSKDNNIDLIPLVSALSTLR